MGVQRNSEGNNRLSIVRLLPYVLYALELLFDVFDCLLVGELVAYAALADVDRGLYAAVNAKRFEECSFSVVLGFDGTGPCEAVGEVGWYGPEPVSLDVAEQVAFVAVLACVDGDEAFGVGD